MYSKLKTYSLVAGAITFVPDVNGAIIYTDVNPDTTYFDPAMGEKFVHNIDFNGDGTNDVTMTLGVVGFVNINTHTTTYIFAYAYEIAAEISATPTAYAWGTAIVFSTSSGIGTGNNWQSDLAMLDWHHYHNGSTSAGNITGLWHGQSGKYLGIKFKIGSNIHYGWVQLSVSVNYPVALTIHSYAYETCPDVAITAGQTFGTCVPISVEDQEVEQGMVDVYGFGNEIHIAGVSKGSVSIYNAIGQEIKTSRLTSTNTTLQIGDPEGVYIVRVNSGGKQITKKVYLN